MKVDDNIRFIAIGNLLDRTLVVEHAPQNKREKVSKIQSAAKDILDKLLLISITANERHTESINNELKILSVVDKNVRWCFLGNNFIYIKIFFFSSYHY